MPDDTTAEASVDDAPADDTPFGDTTADDAPHDGTGADDTRSDGTPTDGTAADDDSDTHAWRTTLLVWAGLAVFAGIWAFVVGVHVFALLRGSPAPKNIWLVPGDLWPPVFAGKVMLYGGSLQPYTLNPTFVAMPLYAGVMLPVSLIVEVFSIPRPFVDRALFETLFKSTTTAADVTTTTTATTTAGNLIGLPQSPFAPVAVAYVMLWAIPFLKVVRSVAWTLGARRRLWTLQVSAFFLCWFPAVLAFGHLEDGLVVTLVLYGVLLTARRQWVQLAIVLSIALSLKQTAALAVPLFFFFVPKGHRLRFVLVTAALPAVLLVAVFLADAASARWSLLNPPTWPGVGGGRTALFITSDEPQLRAGPFRYGAPLVAVAVALWLRRNRSVPLLLAGLAVTAAARLPFEAVLHLYYAAPFLALAAVYEKTRRGNAVFATVFGLGSLLLFWVSLVEIPNWLFWPLWVVLTAAATWPVWVDIARRRFGGPQKADLVVAEAGVGADVASAPSEPDDEGSDADTTSDVGASAPTDGVIL